MSQTTSGLVMVLLALGAGLCAACAPPRAAAGDDSMLEGTALVARQTSFQGRLLLTGELEAVHSEKVYIPRTSAWQVPIRWMELDGATVLATR